MMPRFLERFEHVTPAGDERWRASCPRCDGRRAISVWPGRARWIVKCFAGCRASELLAVVGLPVDDTLFEHKSARAFAQELHRREVPPLPAHHPGPGNGVAQTEVAERSEPELRMLLREHEAGRAQRVPVDAPARPVDAPALARRVFDDMLVRWELRLGADMPEDRPLPYAASEPVRYGLCQHKMQASRALHWLEEHGLIWSPGTTQIRLARPGGTRMFLPGRPPIGPAPERGWRVRSAGGGDQLAQRVVTDARVEPETPRVEPPRIVAQERDAEPLHVVLVASAVAAGCDDVGRFGAPRNGAHGAASDGLLHPRQNTDGSGRESAGRCPS